MDFRFIPPDLRRLDTLQSEALALSFFADERPLRGALGLVDWRLCGFLSRQLRAGRITGDRGEVSLIPSSGRMVFEKLFLVGLGPRNDLSLTDVEGSLRLTLGTLARARVRSGVLALPGRSLGLVAADEAMKILLRTAEGIDDIDDLTVIDEAEAHKPMERVLEQERQRARARAGSMDV
ncbi:MAG: M17 family peptidase N-terminal domain-containing protein [Myxococcota bacterium]